MYAVDKVGISLESLDSRAHRFAAGLASLGWCWLYAFVLVAVPTLSVPYVAVLNCAFWAVAVYAYCKHFVCTRECVIIRDV